MATYATLLVDHHNTLVPKYGERNRKTGSVFGIIPAGTRVQILAKVHKGYEFTTHLDTHFGMMGIIGHHEVCDISG